MRRIRAEAGAHVPSCALIAHFAPHAGFRLKEPYQNWGWGCPRIFQKRLQKKKKKIKTSKRNIHWPTKEWSGRVWPSASETRTGGKMRGEANEGRRLRPRRGPIRVIRGGRAAHRGVDCTALIPRTMTIQSAPWLRHFHHAILIA